MLGTGRPVEQVLRQHDDNRPEFRLRDMEGACHGLRNSRWINDLNNHFRRIGEGLRIVHFLKSVATEFIQFSLPHQKDDRLRVMICDMQGDRRVHGARPPADNADTRLVAKPRMCRRHESSTPLVPTNHQLHVRKINQGVGQRQITLPRYAICDIDTVHIESTGEDVGGGFGHSGSSRISRFISL